MEGAIAAELDLTFRGGVPYFYRYAAEILADCPAGEIELRRLLEEERSMIKANLLPPLGRRWVVSRRAGLATDPIKGASTSAYCLPAP